jgi:plastocyanin
VVVTAGAALAVAGLALPGWNQSTASPYSIEPEPAAPTPSEASASGPTEIGIAQFAFASSPTVAPGSVITVPNADGVSHTLTSSDGLFDTGSISAGSSASFVAPNEPGTYAFFCSIHPSMTGTLTVS